ncbi:MAG: tRNA epoxyqueuosine(34) reductase QueG [SAR324 cluster bacterium]|nr:tRNA epoxyqueuosine(34) reductase QueG [SAR324 cluster bacterium]MBL7034613.1 tRNA epoxyqueuosine(34) reductase QueG [SAR324 cluster bacterium]
MSTASLTRLLKQKAAELGFELVGAVPVSRSKSIDIYNAWLKKGYAGSMAYLERHAELKEDPRRLLPQTMTLLALGFNYNTVEPSFRINNPELGCISRYAWGDDYHKLIRSKLSKLENYLREELNAGKLSRSFVDSGPVLEREVAQRAGLGWIGKHSNLINWKKGSWFFLAELLVDVQLETDLPFTRVDCGTCTICIEACPTEAIVADRTVDARRCISYLTIELKEAIPTELRPKMGNLIFGCDICQQVCPWNKDAPKSKETALQPRPENVAPRLLDLMKLDQAAFSKRFRNSPVKRAKRRGFSRNVAVALGNWADPQAIPALSLGLQDTESLIRSHAAWALGQIPDLQAKTKLEEARKTEKNPEVLAEIEDALIV